LLRHSGRLRTVTCAASTSEEAQHGTPLFGAVPSAAIPAGIFQRHQSEIAGYLLAALKAVGFSDDQHEGPVR